MNDVVSFDIFDFSTICPNEDPLDWFTVEQSMCTQEMYKGSRTNKRTDERALGLR